MSKTDGLPIDVSPWVETRTLADGRTKRILTPARDPDTDPIEEPKEPENEEQRGEKRKIVDSSGDEESEDDERTQHSDYSKAKRLEYMNKRQKLQKLLDDKLQDARRIYNALRGLSYTALFKM